MCLGWAFFFREKLPEWCRQGVQFRPGPGTTFGPCASELEGHCGRGGTGTASKLTVGLVVLVVILVAVFMRFFLANFAVVQSFFFEVVISTDPFLDWVANLFRGRGNRSLEEIYLHVVEILFELIFPR